MGYVWVKAYLYEKGMNLCMNSEEKALKSSVCLPHNVNIDSREKITVSGVEQVENFDENIISMVTTEGKLAISGEGLHIERLSVDTGDLFVTGHVNGIEYSNGKKQKSNLFSRIFG